MEEEQNAIPKHIGIIMDGNRRWAKEQGLETLEGHKKGADTLQAILKHAAERGVKYLTVYAFSTENWNRTEQEVGYLMKLLEGGLDKYIAQKDLKNVRIKAIGGREKLSPTLVNKIEQIEKKTENNDSITLYIAFNYGGRDEIVRATKAIAQEVRDGKISVDDINEETLSNHMFTKDAPDPDLIIRTSGEIRISNFLTWQSTYSEFIFVDKYWPAFTNEDLDNCIAEYSQRKRRKGK